MIRGAAPGQACLRVGPLDTGSLMAWWPEGASGVAGLPGGGSSVSGTLMASDACASDPRVLETADAIFAAGDAHAGPAEWLSRTLGRYPGCEVAAIWNRHGECAVAARDGWFGALSLHGLQDPSVCAFACATFVHGWLAARLPLASIQPPRLAISDRDAFAMPGADKMGTSLLHFRFWLCDL